MLAGAGLLILAAIAIAPLFVAKVVPAPSVPSQVYVTEDVAEPDERKPDDKQEYVVPAQHPRKIYIDDISVMGFVQRVGITAGGSIAVPDNTHYVGWYDGSVAPGEPGLSLIDGHVSGRVVDAIFTHLHQLKEGSYVRIEMGDGVTHTYRVKQVVSVARDEATAEMYKPAIGNDPKVAQLNLITCGGDYQNAEETFSHRLIVKTVLVE